MNPAKSVVEDNFERNIDKFVLKVNRVRQRASNIQQHVGKINLPQQEDTMLLQAVGELQTALEELQVAEEEMKQQNEQLAIARTNVEAERQRYQDLFDFAPDGYLVTDDAGMIREANRAAKLLNVSQEFLIYKPLVNFIPIAERRSFRAKLNQLLQTDCFQEWEIRILPRNQTTFDAAVTVSTLSNLEGKPEGWRWLLRDITVRKQTEAKIRDIELQNLQLQEMARLKSHFLAVVSHELRSPMNAILGFAQLLLRQSHQPLATNQENMVERILRSGKHLLALIEDILDFSKIEAGQLQLKLEELNLAELITATVEEMRPLAAQKNLALQVDFNLQDSLIYSDSVRLRQILVNLISNAIKFTDAGSVQVKVEELLEDRIAIAVKDTGIGIAEADLKQIFQEFWQVNQSISRKHGGTGLGLAIVDRLVRMMQGKIVVESQLGQGSTFRFELPRRVQRREIFS